MKVRVIIPTYNRRELVKQAIASVERQDYPHELIVVDDGSTDGTDIPCVRQENRGVSAARNTGIRAPGEFDCLAFLDADDLWVDPSHLSKSVVILERHPEIGLVFAHTRHVDHTGRDLQPTHDQRREWAMANGKPCDGAYLLTPEQSFMGYLTGELSPDTSSVVMRPAGFFDERMAIFEDIQLFSEAARQSGVAFIAETHVEMHHHGDNLTAQVPLSSPKAARNFGAMLHYAKAMKRLSRTPAELDICKKAIAYNHQMLSWCARDRGNLPLAVWYRLLSAL